VILAGRVSRSKSSWKQRVALAEKIHARVFTDIKVGAAFPTDHPLHAAPPATFLSPDTSKLLREADVVLSLDWVDLAGALKAAWGADPVGAKVIQISPDAHIHRGWSMDYQGLPAVDIYMMCEPDAAVPLLLDAVKPRPGAVAAKPAPSPDAAPAVVSIRALADALNAATKDMEICITRLPLGWNGAFCNDELHQERVAKERSRPVENRWIGQRISGPDIDIAMMARAQGAEGIGPVAKASELEPAIEKGIQAARNGAVCVVDVRVAPGYDTNISGSGAGQKR